MPIMSNSAQLFNYPPRPDFLKFTASELLISKAPKKIKTKQQNSTSKDEEQSWIKLLTKTKQIH